MGTQFPLSFFLSSLFLSFFASRPENQIMKVDYVRRYTDNGTNDFLFQLAIVRQTRSSFTNLIPWLCSVAYFFLLFFFFFLFFSIHVWISVVPFYPVASSFPFQQVQGISTSVSRNENLRSPFSQLPIEIFSRLLTKRRKFSVFHLLLALLASFSLPKSIEISKIMSKND